MNEMQKITTGDELNFEVVDGQQRLTTLPLLLAAIHAKLIIAMDTYEPADEQDKKDAPMKKAANTKSEETDS